MPNHALRHCMSVLGISLAVGVLQGCCCGAPKPPPPRPKPPGAATVAAIPIRPGAGWVPMAVGERWIYAATWNGIPVGTATIEAVDVREVHGRRALHVTCTTQATSFIQTFYHLKDEVATDIDLDTGLPLRFSKHIEEGKRLKDEYIEFDHAGKTATYYRRDTGEGEETFTPVLAMAIPEGVQDPLSSLLRARAMPLKEGGEAVVTVNTDEKTYDTHLRPVRRERLEVDDLGAFNAILLDPSLEYEGIFPNKGKLLMWVEEETRVPLKLQIEIKIGTVHGILILRDGALAPMPQALPTPATP